MNYKEYEESVGWFYKQTKCQIFTTSPDYEEGCIEPHFSWTFCECCGSSLGGDRYNMVACNPGDDPKRYEFTACSNCLYYITYGHLDNLTMLNVEDDTEFIVG